jgi:hypothetical protein
LGGGRTGGGEGCAGAWGGGGGGSWRLGVRERRWKRREQRGRYGTSTGKKGARKMSEGGSARRIDVFGGIGRAKGRWMSGRGL